MLLWLAGQDFWCAVSSFWPTQRLIEMIPICQFIKFSQVRNVILKVRLAPAGTRPIVCVDEAQVSCY